MSAWGANGTAPLQHAYDLMTSSRDGQSTLCQKHVTFVSQRKTGLKQKPQCQKNVANARREVSAIGLAMLLWRRRFVQRQGGAPGPLFPTLKFVRWTRFPSGPGRFC